MKIAQLAPVWYSIPPKKYGGTEEVIFHLTEGLVKKGHDVTLFATGDSQTQAKLVSFFKIGLVDDSLPTGREFFLKPYLHMIKSLDTITDNNFDIIHCHFTTLTDQILLGLTRNVPNCLFTAHIYFPTKKENHNRWSSFHLFPNTQFVSISDNQRNSYRLNFIKTVYHGINITNYPLNDNFPQTNNEYIFWISRVSPHKGILDAIEVSNKTKKKLIFTASISLNSEEDRKYYQQFVEPKISLSNAIPIPELDLQKKVYYFQRAKLFLFPIHWEEPFGLVTIESMACGTPVVAFARGSVPEIVRDGETGFIVNSSNDDIRGNWIIEKTGIEGLCEAVERIYAMPEDQYRQMRRACRAHVEKNFTVETMVDNYEKVYLEILSRKK